MVTRPFDLGVRARFKVENCVKLGQDFDVKNIPLCKVANRSPFDFDLVQTFKKGQTNIRVELVPNFDVENIPVL